MKNGGALPGNPLPGMPPRALVALLIKKSQTLNRIHQHNRQLIKEGFNVFPSKQAAQSAGWAPLEERNAGIGCYLDPNFYRLHFALAFPAKPMHLAPCSRSFSISTD